MKKFTLLLLFVCLTISSFPQRSLYKKNHQLNKKLEKVIAYQGFKTASFAFYAIDVNSREIIAQHNPDMALKPASTLKLLTTASALELLGPAYQFETSLEYSGEIDIAKRMLEGNIIINGGGDPTLGSKYFESTNRQQFLTDWIDAIKALGIDSINGRIVSDARFFSWEMVPPSWSWKNMGNYFGAGPCGLSIYDNAYAIFFKTGKHVGDTAQIVKLVPPIPNLSFENSVTADTIGYDNTNIYGAPYSNERSIRGQLPLDRNNFSVKGSMPDPAFAAAYQLDSVLKKNGVASAQTPSTKRLLLDKQEKVCMFRYAIHTTLSPPLSEIITQTNTQSINLFAEHCLIHSGLQMGATPTTLTSADSVVSFWSKNGMDIQGLSMHDGSGLSQYNAINPPQMVFMLQYMKLKSYYFDTFYNSIPIAGKTGSIRDMFKGSFAEGNLRAKSGTIDGVKAYAGYVTSSSGREIAFSMVVNNFSCTSAEARDKLEELMIAIADFNK